MKIRILWLSLALLVPCHAETYESAVEIEAEGAAPRNFHTATEAITHYKERLWKSKASSLASLAAAFEIESDSKNLNATVEETDEKIGFFWEKAGRLLDVRVCMTPRLGDTLQRVGYLLTYERNIAFADVWFVHLMKGWRFATFDIHAGTDFAKNLREIPAPFYNIGSIQQDAGFVPENLTAFSTVEKEEKTGRFKETIVLGNHRKDLNLTFGDISIHGGQAVRYVRFPAAEKDFLKSITILGREVPLTTFQIKADREMDGTK